MNYSSVSPTVLTLNYDIPVPPLFSSSVVCPCDALAVNIDQLDHSRNPEIANILAVETMWFKHGVQEAIHQSVHPITEQGWRMLQPTSGVQ